MTRMITSLLVLSLVTAGLGTGCGSAFSSKGGTGDDGDGDGDNGDGDNGDGDGDVHGEGGMGGMTARSDDDPTEMGGQGGELMEEPPIEEPPEEPVCDPDAEDAPDDEYFDANCDGIDGEVEGAVFVSPSGSPDGAGTINDPLDTIGAAVALAQDELKDVYICRGEYEERLFLEAEGVNVFGGFNCNDGWARTEDLSVVAPASGPALHLKSVYDIRIEGLEFRAADADAVQFSSIGGIVESSQGVEFKSVVVVAGDARAGASGADGVAFPEGQRGRPGAPGKTTIGNGTCDGCYGSGGGKGEIALPVECPNGQDAEHGGVGGNGEDYDGSPTFQAGSSSPDSGTLGGMAAGESGTNGENGSTGSNAGLSSREIGYLNGIGYVPSNAGADGGFGQNGEAGGGGAGGERRYDGVVYSAGGGGGQGGYGACGGRPGEGGGAGGASVALLVINSSPSFSNVVLRAGNGGNGGDAGAGAEGQLASEPGAPGIRAGDGGAGGRGGRGGHGSPGGGGPSLGIALSGADLEDTSGLTIELGEPGVSGTPVGSRPAAAGGIAAEAYDFNADEEVVL